MRILLLVATLGPVLLIIGSLFSAISAIASGIGALVAVAGTFTAGAGMATYMVFVKWAAIIIAAVALLVAAINVLTGKGDQMRNTIKTMGDTAGNFGSLGGNGLPAYASGTKFHPGGLALVGEQGAELLELPRGTRVYNHNDSKRMLGEQGSSSGDNFQITVNVESLKDVEQLMKLARERRRMERMGKVKG